MKGQVLNHARSSLLTATGLAVFLASAGCYHVIEPVKPPAIPVEEQKPIPAGVSLRLENGYAAPELRRIRAEGIHKLDVDLRDWSARLVMELSSELETRQAEAYVPAESLAGTAPGPLPLTPRGRGREHVSVAARAALRVRITEVVAPDAETGRGPRLAASLESKSGDFAASYATGPEAKGFSDALLDLKKRILEDQKFLAWLATTNTNTTKKPEQEIHS